eukprot:scaffold7473_cov403-Prasinococcus_capsulatus_cf.AAC.2
MCRASASVALNHRPSSPTHLSLGFVSLLDNDRAGTENAHVPKPCGNDNQTLLGTGARECCSPIHFLTTDQSPTWLNLRDRRRSSEASQFGGYMCCAPTIGFFQSTVGLVQVALVAWPRRSVPEYQSTP